MVYQWEPAFNTLEQGIYCLSEFASSPRRVTDSIFRLYVRGRSMAALRAGKVEGAYHWLFDELQVLNVRKHLRDATHYNSLAGIEMKLDLSNGGYGRRKLKFRQII